MLQDRVFRIEWGEETSKRQSQTITKKGERKKGKEMTSKFLLQVISTNVN